MTNKDEFMAGLERLTQKTGVKIASCGCCRSPWIETIDPIDMDGGEYQHEDYSDVEWVSGRVKFGNALSKLINDIPNCDVDTAFMSLGTQSIVMIPASILELTTKRRSLTGAGGSAVSTNVV